jgi:hypothetical protein
MATNIENKFNGRFAEFFCYMNNIEYDSCHAKYDDSNHTQPVTITWTKGNITEGYNMNIIEALDYLSPEIIPEDSDSSKMSKLSESLLDL